MTYKVQGEKKVLKLTRPEKIVRQVEGKDKWDLSGDPEAGSTLALAKANSIASANAAS